MKERGFSILHRISEPDGDWYHVMPVGEFPGMVMEGPKGKHQRVTEVIDAEALSRIMAAYEAAHAADPDWQGYLVGQEHFAEDPGGTTEAYAWAVELKVRNTADVPERERGIWARMHKTPLGESAIGSVYKFFSTVNPMEHVEGDRYRPVAIENIGLTNRPAYKNLMPALHRDQTEEADEMLDKLKQLLAKHKVQVADDAGEDKIVEAVDTALTAGVTATAELATARHRVTELETADAERKADDFVAAHKDKVTDEAKLRELYVKHGAAAEELVGLIKAPAATAQPTRTLHRQDGATPPDQAVAEKTDEQKSADAAQARRIRHRADELQSSNKSRSWNDCWNQAKSEVEKG